MTTQTSLLVRTSTNSSQKPHLNARPGGFDTRSLTPSADSSIDLQTPQQPSCALAPSASPHTLRRVPPPRPPPPLCPLHVDGSGSTAAASIAATSSTGAQQEASTSVRTALNSAKPTITTSVSRSGSKTHLARVISGQSSESARLFAPNTGPDSTGSPEFDLGSRTGSNATELCVGSAAQHPPYSHSPSLDVSTGESNGYTAQSTAGAARPVSPPLELPSLTSTLTLGRNTVSTSGAARSCPACTAPHVGMLIQSDIQYKYECEYEMRTLQFIYEIWSNECLARLIEELQETRETLQHVQLELTASRLRAAEYQANVRSAQERINDLEQVGAYSTVCYVYCVYVSSWLWI